MAATNWLKYVAVMCKIHVEYLTVSIYLLKKLMYTKSRRPLVSEVLTQRPNANLFPRFSNFSLDGRNAGIGWHVTELRAARPRTCDQTAGRAKRISPPRRSDQPWRPPGLLRTGYRGKGAVLMVKWPGREPDPMSITDEVKNKSSSHPLAAMPSWRGA